MRFAAALPAPGPAARRAPRGGAGAPARAPGPGRPGPQPAVAVAVFPRRRAPRARAGAEGSGAEGEAEAEEAAKADLVGLDAVIESAQDQSGELELVREEFAQMSALTLQDKLRTLGLNVSGRKAELVERLVNAHVMAKEDPSSLVGGKFLEAKSVDELEIMLKNYGVNQTGNKQELIERLKQVLANVKEIAPKDLPKVNLQRLSEDELVQQLRMRGLPVWGTRDELLLRLETAIEAQAQGFLDAGLTMSIEDNLYSMTVPELKQKLKARDLPTTGRKADLVARLKAAMEEENPGQGPGPGPGAVDWSDTSSLQEFFESSYFGAEEKKVVKREGAHEPKYIPGDEEYALYSPAYSNAGRGYEPPPEGPPPADDTALLDSYANLDNKHYEKPLDAHADFAGQGYRCFDMGPKADFLVRSEGDRLDFSDVVMYQKEVGAYCRPSFSGKPAAGLAKYYAYPWVRWMPGVPYADRPEEASISKMIFVEIASEDPGDWRLKLENTFVLDGENTRVLSTAGSADERYRRHGKAGLVRARAPPAGDPGRRSAPTSLSVRFSKIQSDVVADGEGHDAAAQEFCLRVQQEHVEVSKWWLLPNTTNVVETFQGQRREAEAARFNPYIEDAEESLSEYSPFSQTGEYDTKETEWKWKNLGLLAMEERGEIPEELEPELEPNFFEVETRSESNWYQNVETNPQAFQSRMDFRKNIKRGKERWRFEEGRWILQREEESSIPKQIR